MTDGTGAVVWRAEHLPFGSIHSLPVSTVTNNLRFPGQYFDSETGLHQNWFRDYDSAIGRYREADPLGGLVATNIFTYTENNPVRNLDPQGLFVIVGCGNASPIVHSAARDAFRVTRNCLPCGAQFERLRNALLNAVIDCNSSLINICGFSQGGRISLNLHVVVAWARNPGRQVPLGSGGPCPCLPALLTHEAAHQAFGSHEAVPERIENRCFGCATPPGPGELVVQP